MAKPTGGTELDAALDELYGAAPAEFTPRRDALAKRLKEAGDAAAASELKARRKPTQLAYVLNQLARRHADDVAELVDVGRELARAQRKALRGEAGHDLRDAIARQRGVVAGLTSKAAKLMGELGVAVSGHLDEIAGALRTAMVDPGVGAQLEEGRLEKVPETAAGFPGTTTLQLVRSEPEAPDADADANANAKAHAHAHAHAKAHRAETTRAEARERAREEQKERERAKRRDEATTAGAEAAERARIADEAERAADGHAAEAKKLDDEAEALAAEAKRIAAEAKHLAAEAKARAAAAKATAHEAEAARRKADRAATEAGRADKHAKLARSEADRAVKHAHTVAARAEK
jgi:hypothetical protein